MTLSSPNSNATLHPRLFLTGFMGAGKSTIGRILARYIGYRFFDTDHLVMKGFRKPVSRIFEENGARAFHDAEVQVLRALQKRQEVVVSTGGGTLVRDDTFKIARASGTLIYLRAPVADLYERVIFSPKDRPRIDVPEEESMFKERFEHDRRYYEQADITVDTIDRKPDDVAREIIEKLQLKVLDNA